AAAAVHGEADLWRLVLASSPKLLTYLMSFMTLGIFWVGQQAQLNLLERTDRDFAWLHIGFLAAVSLVPFSTAFLSEFIVFRIPLLVYLFNIQMLGLLLYGSWQLARRHKLMKDDLPPNINRIIFRRIVIAQALYTFGAALCVFSTFWSIGFIVAVQLSYAIAPRFRPFTWM
ncbi:MAG TPA: TMEM175 family protein, partial [Rhizomicrobium sp.]|nr:TMEM175 family protein [Rhizomicrobium sp.]